VASDIICACVSYREFSDCALAGRELIAYLLVLIWFGLRDHCAGGQGVHGTFALGVAMCILGHAFALAL
jgi:hypothetical protein